MVWFDCSRGECLRRAIGRRIDAANNLIYHIQDNPPSIEKSPLCEIIEPIDDESESMACLVDRWVAFDQAKSGIEKWLTQFGDESTSFNLLHRIEASQDITSVYTQIDRILATVVEHKMRTQATLRANIQSEILRNEELQAEKLKAQQEAEEAK